MTKKLDNKETGTCEKCNKPGRLREIIISGIPKKVCEECIKTLQRKWTDWYSKR